CFYSDDVPRHYAFNRSFNRLTPETVKIVNDAVVQAAVELGLEDGAKLRVDTTVVETDVLRAAARKTSNAEHIVMRSPNSGTPQIGLYDDISLRITMATERRDQCIRRLEAPRPQFQRQHCLQGFRLHRWISPCVNLRRLHVCVTVLNRPTVPIAPIDEVLCRSQTSAYGNGGVARLRQCVGKSVKQE